MFHGARFSAWNVFCYFVLPGFRRFWSHGSAMNFVGSASYLRSSYPNDCPPSAARKNVWQTIFGWSPQRDDLSKTKGMGLWRCIPVMSDDVRSKRPKSHRFSVPRVSWQLVWSNGPRISGWPWKSCEEKLWTLCLGSCVFTGVFEIWNLEGDEEWLMAQTLEFGTKDPPLLSLLLSHHFQGGISWWSLHRRQAAGWTVAPSPVGAARAHLCDDSGGPTVQHDCQSGLGQQQPVTRHVVSTTRNTQKETVEDILQSYRSLLMILLWCWTCSDGLPFWLKFGNHQIKAGKSVTVFFHTKWDRKSHNQLRQHC